MNIKKVKIDKVFIDEIEKEITSKKNGKTYMMRNVSIRVSDDCKDYAGRWIRTTMFGDEKNSSQNKAEYFKSQNEGKEIIINVEEQPYTSKDGEEKIALQFKLLSKKEKELAEQFLN